VTLEISIVKKTKNTPEQELKIARKRMEEVKHD
jgi:phage-related protein